MLTHLILTVWPIAVAVGAGYLLGKVKRIPSRPLADAGIFLFGPCLLLGHYRTDIATEIPIMVTTLATVLLLLGASWVMAAKVLRIDDRDHRTGFVMSVALSNFGFFGLPLVTNALGPQAFGAGMAVMTILNVPTGILAAYLASPHGTVRGAIRDAAGIPTSWAVTLALGLGFAQIELPTAVTGPLRMIGEATIPLMLVVLGIELSNLRASSLPLSWWGTASAMRLLLPAPIALGLMWLLNIPVTALSSQSALLQLSTPAGITPLLMMTSFRRKTDLLSATILLTTLASMLTLPLLIAVLRGL